jgi:acetyl esterase/lipase
VLIYNSSYSSVNNQANYRKITSRLSKLTGLPCVTVLQRLAPQNPFPAALLDVFHGYMSLLSPPPGSPHPAIPASSIVLAGDSSGGCLALGLIQVLLALKRSGLSSIDYHGRTVDLALPAGLTVISAALDLTHGLPSNKSNYLWDVFPSGITPTVLPGFPSCDIWPSNPPRENVYCEGPLLYHPIASPTASRDWTGSPPLWFASGQEQTTDSVKVIAMTAHSQGVPVIYHEYEAMPHVFMLSLPDSPQSHKCWMEWAAVCKTLLGTKTIPSSAAVIEAKGLNARELKLSNLTPLTVDDARRYMRAASKNYPLYTGQKENNSKL